MFNSAMLSGFELYPRWVPLYIAHVSRSVVAPRSVAFNTKMTKTEGSTLHHTTQHLNSARLVSLLGIFTFFSGEAFEP